MTKKTDLSGKQRRPLGDRGSTMIEGLLTLTLVVSVGSIAFTTLVLMMTKIWVRHQAYEATLCRAAHEDVTQCLNTFSNSMGVLGSLIELKEHRLLGVGRSSEFFAQIRVLGYSDFIHLRYQSE